MRNMPSAASWPCLAVHMDPDGDHPHSTLRLAVDAGIGSDTNGNQEDFGGPPRRRMLAAEAHLLNGEDHIALQSPPSGNTVWGGSKSGSAFPIPLSRPLATATRNTHALDCTPHPLSQSVLCAISSISFPWPRPQTRVVTRHRLYTRRGGRLQAQGDEFVDVEKL